MFVTFVPQYRVKASSLFHGNILNTFVFWRVTYVAQLYTEITLLHLDGRNGNTNAQQYYFIDTSCILFM
jgi:hypothetical protein